MKHLFTLKSLMLTLVMLFGLNAWGETATLTFTKACGGSGTDDKGNTWTVTSDAAESNYDGTKGIHYGTSSKAVSYLQLTSSIGGTITSVKVNASGASGTSAKLNVTVGGSAFGSESSITKTATDYEFTGEATGDIVVKLSQASATKALYVKSIVVTYEVVAAAVEKPTITASAADLNGNYFTTSTAKATIACETKGATIKYAITDGAEPAVDEWKVYSAEVEIASAEPATKTLWAKAVKGTDESVVASKEFTFIEKPELITYEQVTSESQIVPGRKYVIACTGATNMAIMGAISGEIFSAKNTDSEKAYATTIIYTDNKLSFVNSDAIYVTFEKAAASFADGHANDDATTIWNVKIGDEYITQTAVKKMAMSAVAPTEISMSIDAEGNFVLKFGANYFCYNSGSPRFTTYDKQGTTNTNMKIQLFREPEKMASVMSAAPETAVELPVSVVGRKVFGDYLLASTVNNGGAQLESPSLAEAKHFWSNDPEKFNQESWIAIECLDEYYVGKEFEVGQTLTAAGADATYGFPTYTVATPTTSGYAGALEINNYSASNFNIGGTDESVANVWLVAPQLGEYCQIHGYVDADLADETYAWVQANEKSNVYATVYFNGLPKFTTSGWYNIEGVVAKDGEGLAIYATAVDTATGVEGVEASSVKVYGAEGVINVVSEEVAPIAVYSANGAIVSSVEASSASIAVAPGFYIVKAGNSVSKVTVK